MNKVSNMQQKPLLALSMLAVLWLAAFDLQAQLYSYDGNRWYEIEVAVFTQDYSSALVNEKPAAQTVTLAYQPRLRLLKPAAASFQVDFNDLQERELNQEPKEPDFDVQAPTTASTNAGFRIDDFGRDPFISLDSRYWSFTQELSKLQGASHNVLWHAVWRQPMQGSSQAAAVAVIGGEAYAEHNQLEGSMRFSDNGGRVNMDIQLWLNRFTNGRARTAEDWKLPDQPQAVASAAVEPAANENRFGIRTNTSWVLEEVWQIKESKEVRTEEFYYLDNPAFGVLLQIRTYELPDKVSASTEEDF